MNTFGILFKKYRLKAEFASLTELADAFSEKGYIYDLSILSQWQKGKRVPTKRIILVALIRLFMERQGVVSLEQANEFMESAGHGYLTNKEQHQVLKKNSFSKSSERLLFD